MGYLSASDDVAERFWSKVEVDGDCWMWVAARNPSGHGRFYLGRHVRPRMAPAHRIAYELLVGEVPENLHLDHLCLRPPCVNPDHLEPVTLWENLRRNPTTPAVINARKTHCKRGHKFDAANTHVTKKGSRICLTCARIRAAGYRKKGRK